MANSEDDRVYEGIINDGLKSSGTGIDWRTYKLPGLETAKHQAAGVEAIRAARHEAVVVNSEQLAEVGIAKLVRYAQFAHHVAQVEPELAPVLRAISDDLVTILRNAIYKYNNNQEER